MQRSVQTAAPAEQSYRMRAAAYTLVVLAGCCLADKPAPAAEPVDFNREIRPLLSDTCYQCHGPDEAHRQAELRLDRQSDAFAHRENGLAIVLPFHPERSELYRRITSSDSDLKMPPPDSDRSLTAPQVELIRRWISEGASWEEHWAYVPPTPTTPPRARNFSLAAPAENAIDHFVRFQLEEADLVPAPAADREALIRRVTLDLTGLPPTPEEVEAFIADERPVAYERLVDRLLASPRYGEHMAVPWLDAARYADTSGYQNDGPRDMWRYRDWVIDALNANMPFDRFTIEQLAGDLLPQPSLSQWIATGFNRNHRGNAEGGIVPEEYAVEYVVDRVETTAAVWLGLTLGCARCHDHKYDPFSQRDFYRLYAFFNNIPENGRAIKEGNSPPFVAAPTPREEQELKRLQLAVGDAKREYEQARLRYEPTFRDWRKNTRLDRNTDWQPSLGLHAHFPLQRSIDCIPTENRPTAWQGEPGNFVSEQHRYGVRFSGETQIEAPQIGDFGYFDAFTLAAWIRPDGTTLGTVMSRATDDPEGDGYRVNIRDGRIQVHLVKRWLDDAIRISTMKVVKAQQWQHLAVVYDGSRRAEGITVYLDGEPLTHVVELDGLNQSFRTAEPFRIGGGSSSRFRGVIGDVRVYDRPLSPGDVALLAVPESIDEIAKLPHGEATTPARQRKLWRYFLEQHAPAELRAAHSHWKSALSALSRFEQSISTVMVMQERPDIRKTHVLVRGVYDQPGELVERGVPELLGSFPANQPSNRLGLAAWLLAPENPLTARVAVNRAWQHFFGIGLVKTTEDFGVQGERPSHPELLDWLATEFRRTDWNVKAMHRLIVTSATYRQDSREAPELARRDPENRLLARGPRKRLTAEAIRDQALAAGGLLVEKLGGPSVKPYQPTGLWEEISTGGPYHQDSGPALYRRGLYTFWKRTVSPPSMVTFDASTRETCVVQRPRTNTPLQALLLMNDVTYVEAARALAERTLTESAAEPPSRLTYAFRLATGRHPTGNELDILERSLSAHLSYFAQHPGEAEQLTANGESPVSPMLDRRELAAYTAIANLLINLDEVVNNQ